MSGLDDAIARRQTAHAAATQYEDAKADQLTWTRAESLTLTRRFVESIRKAGYRPLSAKRLRLTCTPQQVRVGSWPSRRTTTECAWTRTALDVGEAWPVLGQQWTTLVPDSGGDNLPFRPWRDVYAGMAYLPGTGGPRRSGV